MKLFIRSKEKMKICKQILEEININGTVISKEAKTHIAVCGSCAEAYRLAAELETVLLSTQDFKAPDNLKPAVLKAVKTQLPRKSPPQTLGFALKTAGILMILISGFWLGLLTANNGNGRDSKISTDFNIIKASPYRLNTVPLNPENLNEIYFSVLEDTNNGK